MAVEGGHRFVFNAKVENLTSWPWRQMSARRSCGVPLKTAGKELRSCSSALTLARRLKIENVALGDNQDDC
jgi:hypothetical protein